MTNDKKIQLQKTNPIYSDRLLKDISKLKEPVLIIKELKGFCKEPKDFLYCLQKVKDFKDEKKISPTL